MPKDKTAIVIPTYNGKDIIHKSIDSLLDQIAPRHIIVVDNASTDGTSAYLNSKYPNLQIISNSRNLGFSGGVNTGIKQALSQGYKYIALFNNDAEAEEDWLKALEQVLDKNSKLGIATGKILDKTKKQFDSTGDIYSTWGMPFPRGRGDIDEGQYSDGGLVFGASGGASLYRSRMLQEIGLFDQDFFAYFEDVDISFRAQLAGWCIYYEPNATVYHSIGQTSAKLPGFTTYHTFKNLPLLFWKNVPLKLILPIFLRFAVLYISIFISAIFRGQIIPTLRGLLMSLLLLPKKLFQRWSIQSKKRVSADYINSILWHDLPPNSHKLRKLRHYLSLGIYK